MKQEATYRSEKKWVRRTLRQLSKGLEKLGYQLGKNTEGRLLKKHDYSLRQNRKEKSTKSHPNRDRQFRYINRVKKLFWCSGYPVRACRYKKERTDRELLSERKDLEKRSRTG